VETRIRFESIPGILSYFGLGISLLSSRLARVVVIVDEIDVLPLIPPGWFQIHIIGVDLERSNILFLDGGFDGAKDILPEIDDTNLDEKVKRKSSDLSICPESLKPTSCLLDLEEIIHDLFYLPPPFSIRLDHVDVAEKRVI
jgi:hypothetical protein